MENILNNKSFTTTELEIINACRLYLQVSRVSDIATINGKRENIPKKTSLNSEPPTHGDTKNDPTQQHCSYGQKLLPAQSVTNLENFKEHLARGMQQWKTHGNTVMSPTHDALFSKTPQGWRSHDITRHGLTKRFTTTSKPSEPPSDLYPAIPKRITSKLICTNHQSSGRLPITETKTTSNNFQEYLNNNTEPWEAHLLDNTREIHGNEPDLKMNLQLGKDLFFVSDGGDTDGCGYFGWVIANDITILCQDNRISPGNTELNKSLRSESTAYLSMLRYL
eukprot:scaffold284375_cov71-Attheya_sp.AAC.7